MAPSRQKCQTFANLAPALLIIAAVVALCSIERDTAAQEPTRYFDNEPPKVDDVDVGRTRIPSFLQETLQGDKEKEKDKDKVDPVPKKKEWDPAVVSMGQSGFNRGCLKCHDANRSLRKTKDFSGWLATVRRMAAMRDAQVPASDIVPIATYLASLNPNATPPNGADTTATPTDQEKGDDKGSFSAFAVLSPYFRGGSTDVENRGFVPETWFGAAWHGEVVSARISACISCHPNKLDPVEAAVRVDFSKWLEPVKPGLKGGVEAGRFIVPFSAFSSAPMLYRTVSRPLMFSMGQGVQNDLIDQTVLPMPYTDTGINANFSVPICDLGEQEFRVGVDGYVINGLSGSNDGIDWATSRNNYNLNQNPALGARVTAGMPLIRFGASYMGGNYLPSGNSPLGSAVSPFATPFIAVLGGTNTDNYSGRLTYKFYGFDVVAQYDNLLRFQFEYARRSNDRFGALIPNAPRTVFDEHTTGYYFEVEGRPTREFPVSAIVRYDRHEREGPVSPQGSYIAGTFQIQRFTYGVNVNLWRDSLLMINHERWWFSSATGLGNVDVFGVRYMVSF